MKKITAVFLSGIMALTLAGCGSSSAASAEDTSLKDIQDAGKIRIGLEGDWQPFSYHDESDTLVGYDVEVAKAVAEKLGVEADITEAPWDGLLTGLDTGVYDIVVNGVDVTEERQKAFGFSDPYAYDHVDLVTLADNTDIRTFDDLKGRTSANSTGSTYAELGEQYGATVSNVPTLAETMELVLNGTVDATINADTSVQDYLKTTGETRLKVAAQTDDVTEYAIPMKKGSDSLREAVNDALKQLREDGTLAELSVKYFGADLTNK
ncbi:MAG: transporter substrate-binding domain-containing protein [Bulleidia sp.]|nr:transporter substrate-binding domain-containing protein [Bulleidia sp.]